MTEYGKWLGKNNGKQMIIDISKNGATKEQFRAAITTYCILFNIEVDSKEWDDLIKEMFDSYNSWDNNIEEFDLYMSALLV